MIELYVTNAVTGEFRQVFLDLNSTQNQCSIGRFTASDLILSLPDVSRLHATIRMEQGQYILVDHNSTGGTSLNEKLIQPMRAYPLRTKDHFKIGSFSLTIEALIVETSALPSSLASQVITPIRLPVAS
jgi:pSer/pThr/pTyr-binding forkhead associated (FHA) protein